jgi:hypothetical protein
MKGHRPLLGIRQGLFLFGAQARDPGLKIVDLNDLGERGLLLCPGVR